MTNRSIRTATVLPGLAAAVLALAACSGSPDPVSPTGTGVTASSSASTAPATGATEETPTPTTGTATTPAAPGSGGIGTPAVPTSAAPSIAIPTYLCTAAAGAQDAADAYVGALGAGSYEQAAACVLPGTVPEAMTRSLLVSDTQGAAYLLDATRSTATTFVYTGRQNVAVTVTLAADGHHWVTAVTVS